MLPGDTGALLLTITPLPPQPPASLNNTQCHATFILVCPNTQSKSIKTSFFIYFQPHTTIMIALMFLCQSPFKTFFMPQIIRE